jgi:hypothetical protein
MTPKQYALKMLELEWSWLCDLTLMHRAIDDYEETGDEHWAFEAMRHQFEALAYYDEFCQMWRSAYLDVYAAYHGMKQRFYEKAVP